MFRVYTRRIITQMHDNFVFWYLINIIMFHPSNSVRVTVLITLSFAAITCFVLVSCEVYAVHTVKYCVFLIRSTRYYLFFSRAVARDLSLINIRRLFIMSVLARLLQGWGAPN